MWWRRIKLSIAYFLREQCGEWAGQVSLRIAVTVNEGHQEEFQSRKMLKPFLKERKTKKTLFFSCLVALAALCNVNRRRKESVSRTVVGVCVLVCVWVSFAHVISHTSSDYRVTMCAQNKISIFAFLCSCRVCASFGCLCVGVSVSV